MRCPPLAYHLNSHLAKPEKLKMTKFLFFLAVLIVLSAGAAEPTVRGVMANSNGVVTAPANFWPTQALYSAAFSNAVVAVAPSGGGGGSTTNLTPWPSPIDGHNYGLGNAWLSNTVKAAVANITNFFAGVASASVPASAITNAHYGTNFATLYVDPNGSDSNPGTVAQPFLTITNAIAHMGVSNTLNILKGTYNIGTNKMIPPMGYAIDGHGSLILSDPDDGNPKLRARDNCTAFNFTLQCSSNILESIGTGLFWGGVGNWNDNGVDNHLDAPATNFYFHHIHLRNALSDGFYIGNTDYTNRYQGKIENCDGDGMFDMISVGGRTNSEITFADCDFVTYQDPLNQTAAFFRTTGGTLNLIGVNYSVTNITATNPGQPFVLLNDGSTRVFIDGGRYTLYNKPGQQLTAQWYGGTLNGGHMSGRFLMSTNGTEWFEIAPGLSNRWTTLPLNLLAFGGLRTNINASTSLFISFQAIPSAGSGTMGFILKVSDAGVTNTYWTSAYANSSVGDIAALSFSHIPLNPNAVWWYDVDPDTTSSTLFGNISLDSATQTFFAYYLYNDGGSSAAGVVVNTGGAITVTGDASGSGVASIPLVVSNVRGTLTNSTTGNAATATLATTANAALTLTDALGLTNGSIPSARYKGAGVNSVKLGSAAAAGGNSISIGPGADSTGSNSIAIGYGALGQSKSATAIGDAANAAYQDSTAIGQNSATTKTNQVTLGLANGEVNIPGNLQFSTGNLGGGTNIPAAQLTGTVPDARLSANVPLLDRDPQTFSGVNKFAQIAVAGTTNTSLTAYQFVATDANKKLVSTVDGSALTALNASQLTSGLIPKAAAGALSNHSDVTITGTAPVSGDTLRWSGTAWTNAALFGFYVIDFFDTGNNSYSANTTYYVGRDGARVVNTSYAVASVPILTAGTVVSVSYSWDASSTLGSGEVANFWIEINNATDIGNFQSPINVATTNKVVTGLTQAVTATDTAVLKITTPATWSTPATAVRFKAQALVKVPL